MVVRGVDNILTGPDLNGAWKITEFRESYPRLGVTVVTCHGQSVLLRKGNT